MRLRHKCCHFHLDLSLPQNCCDFGNWCGFFEALNWSLHWYWSHCWRPVSTLSFHRLLRRSNLGLSLEPAGLRKCVQIASERSTHSVSIMYQGKSHWHADQSWLAKREVSKVLHCIEAFPPFLYLCTWTQPFCYVLFCLLRVL